MEDDTISGELALRFLRESDTVVYLAASLDGRLLDWNPAARRRLDLDDDRRETSLWDRVPEDDARRLRDAGDESGAPISMRVNFVGADQHTFTLSCLVLRREEDLHLVGEDISGDRERLEADLMELNQELSVMNRERARQARELAETKERLESTLEELETSYWHLKKVQEVIPVCMHCHRIRGDDDASWDQVAEYFRKNSIFVSHGLCPECAERHYGEDAKPDPEQERSP